MIEVKATPKFMRLAKKSMTPKSLQDLIDTLALHPGHGIIIRNSGGIRKIRWGTGKGGTKRNSLRIIYYFNGKYLVLLLTLFKKADQDNIEDHEIMEIRKLIDELLEK